jgi:hypothetical protein
MIGWLDCERLLVPRMRIFEPSPAMPPVGTATTPGSRPCRTSDMLVTGAVSRSRVLMVATVLPRRRTSVACPAPVTTTSSRAMAEGWSVKSARTVSPAATVTVTVCVA